MSVTPISEIQGEHGIVGRSAELAASLAILGGGRHLLLEGPVGVGKTTVALAVCRHLGRQTVRIDGDDRYTESKLTGWFDPPLVLKAGYSDETFFAGPLVEAMRGGSVLFINELNRMPEAVQNVLLPALDERFIIVPRIGEVRAADGFLVVATQNPVEYIATGHLSEALRDRFEHVALEYQALDEEAEIVRRATGCADDELVDVAVAVMRETRASPRFRKGASIRAAMAMVEIAERLLENDGALLAAGSVPGVDPNGDAVALELNEDARRLRALHLAAMAALPTRVELHDEEEGSLDDVLADLLAEARKK